MSFYNTSIYSVGSARSIYNKLSGEPSAYKSKMKGMLEVGNLNLDFKKTSKYSAELEELSVAAKGCSRQMDSIISDLSGSKNRAKRNDARELKAMFIQLATDSKALSKTIRKTETQFKNFDNNFAKNMLAGAVGVSTRNIIAKRFPSEGVNKGIPNVVSEKNRGRFFEDILADLNAKNNVPKENEADKFLEKLKSLIKKHTSPLEALIIDSRIGATETPETMLGYLSEEQQASCNAIAEDIIKEGEISDLSSEQVGNLLVLIYGFDGNMDEAANSKDLQQLIELCQKNPEVYTILTGTSTAKEKAEALTEHYNSMSTADFDVVLKTLTKQDVFDRIPDDQIRKDTIEKLGLNDDMSLSERMAWMETLQIQSKKDIISGATANRDESLANDFFGTYNESISKHMWEHSQWLASNERKVYGLPSQHPTGGNGTQWNNWQDADSMDDLRQKAINDPSLLDYQNETKATWVHTGTDVGGTHDVYATTPGTLMTAKDYTNSEAYGAGTAVTIQDQNNNTHWYPHLSSIEISDERIELMNTGTDVLVLPGEKIGVSGMTGGTSTGPHLHYEVQDSDGGWGDPAHDLNPNNFMGG